MKALAAFTQSGDTVRRLARLHPRRPILAFTPEPAVCSRLERTWGTETNPVPPVESTEALMRAVDEETLAMSRFAPNNEVVVTVGSINLLRVHRQGADDTV